MIPLNMSTKNIGLLLLGGGVAAVALWYIGREALAVAGGIITGDNAITQNQTNAAGERTTAYEGAGVLGTVGAATNSALGGIPASVGETVGGWIFDVFGPKSPN
jgi:hypothetical protein